MTEASATAADAARTPDLGKQTPGEYLRRLREEKGHTHAAVGTALHLTVHYIKALEADEYGKLPGLTFVKGYLRSYARFLGADVDGVIARFDEHITSLLDAGKHTARVERSRRRQDQALRWAVGAGFVVVVGIVTGWWFVSGRDVPETAQRVIPPAAQTANVSARPQATPTATPQRSATTSAATLAPPSIAAPQSTLGVSTQANTAPEAPGEPAGNAGALITDTGTAAEPAMPAQQDEQAAVNTEAAAEAPATGARNVSLVAAGDDELRVTFAGDSWIEVDDGNRVRLYNDMLRTGDTLMIRGEAPFHVLLGDASKVRVSLNAAPVDISADIRGDNTARLVIGTSNNVPAANNAPAAGQEVQQ